MRQRRVLTFIACAVPAAALAVMLPWWVYDPLVRLGVPEDPVVYQACIVLTATALMVGIAVAWHIAGWPLVGQSDDVPPFLRENRYPAAVIILVLIAGAWGIAGVTAAADVVDAIAAWGFVGQVVTGLFAAFVMSLIGLGLKLVSREGVTRSNLAESTPTALKILAALLLAFAGYVQRIGEWIADRLQGRRPRV